MSDVKELTVSLQPQDEKALSRTKTRRRRRNAGVLEAVGGEAEPMAIVKADTAAAAQPIAVEPIVIAKPSTSILDVTPTVTTPVPALSTTTVVGGGVILHAKKVADPTPAPRIIPHKKRVSGAAATHTLKKAKFVVTPTPHPLPAKARAEGGKSRVFSERKISITMRPSSSTRRMRRTLKSKIASMPLPAIKRMLLRKGVLKPKATAPPEEMMRSMLRDYMLLHAAE